MMKEIFQRLKHASVAEVAYRIRTKFTALRIKKALRRRQNTIIVPPVDQNLLESVRLPAVNISSTYYQHFGPKSVDIPAARPHWNSEEIERFERRHRYCFFDEITIQISDPDIRTVWESARLQEAALLLLADAPPNESKRKKGQDAVLIWIRNNPFLRGPHYMSAMECGLRLPVFVYCLKTAMALNIEEQRIIYRAAFEHAWWIERNLSLYASLGNHTVCECVGLIFAGALFLNVSSGRQWLRTACQLLTQEIDHQILPDGGPAEQSTAYHRFVLDLYWLAADFLEKNHLYDCSLWKSQLVKGETFLRTLQFQDNIPPLIGDSDNGQAVGFGATPIRANPNPAGLPVTTFTNSGYTVYRGAKGLLLTFDHGPLGMAPLYNHGHADALAVTLGINGNPLLVDTGTYRYNGVPNWRKYFKGTRAHNTVTVDGQDQAVQVSSFIWSRPYRAVLCNIRHGREWVWMQGRHDGYSRLNDPVIHVRCIFIENDTHILIRDSFQGRGIHEFELNLHLHPDAVLTAVDGWVAVNMNGTVGFIGLNEGTVKLRHGCNEPLSGWYSPAYGIRRPSPTLVHHIRKATSETVFTTIITIDTPCDAARLIERFETVENQTTHS